MPIFIGNHTKIKKLLRYVWVSERENHPVILALLVPAHNGATKKDAVPMGAVRIRHIELKFQKFPRNRARVIYVTIRD
jgi:hypothetical protein